MVRRLNIVVSLVLLAIVAAFVAIGVAFGLGYGAAFVLGWVASTWLWQTAHKSRYGHYFRPPVIDGDALDGN